VATDTLVTGQGLRDAHLANLSKIHALQQGQSVLVNADLVNVQGTLLRHIIITSLTLLLLQPERDAAHRPSLNASHKTGGVAGNLVAETLGRDLGKVVEDALVGLEVEGQLGVVLFDENAGSALDGFGADAALMCVVSNAVRGQEREGV
jgi:hypothetical protein